MTPTQLTALMARVRELWPKCNWTAAAEDAFLAGVANLDVSDEQWRACVDECWRESKYGQPDQSVLTSRLRELNRANRTGPAATAAVNPQRAWRETPEQAAAFERGLAEATAWARTAPGKEIAAAREAHNRMSRGVLTVPPTSRNELLANPGRCVALFAANRRACRMAAAGQEDRT